MSWTVVPSDGLRAVAPDDPRIDYGFEIFRAVNELERIVGSITNDQNPVLTKWWKGGFNADEREELNADELNNLPFTNVWLYADEDAYTNFVRARDALIAIIEATHVVDLSSTEEVAIFNTGAPDYTPLSVDSVFDELDLATVFDLHVNDPEDEESPPSEGLTDILPNYQYDFRYWKMLQDIVDQLRYFSFRATAFQNTWDDSGHWRQISTIQLVSSQFTHEAVADAWTEMLADTEVLRVGEDMGGATSGFIYGNFGWVLRHNPAVLSMNPYAQTAAYRAEDLAFSPPSFVGDPVNGVGDIVGIKTALQFANLSEDLVPDDRVTAHIEDASVTVNFRNLGASRIAEVEHTVRQSGTAHPNNPDLFPLLFDAELSREDETGTPTTVPFTDHQADFPTDRVTWSTIGAKVFGFLVHYDAQSALSHNL